VSDNVIAFIEVQVTPERGKGFDAVAERIYKFPQVVSTYLLSGSYDLLVVLEGSNLQEVAAFVAEKLATLDRVKQTRTHFLLKKYKEQGQMMEKEATIKKMPVSP